MSIFHRTHHDEDVTTDRGTTVDERTDEGRHADTRATTTTRGEPYETAHDRFGGINWGAAFFGWLVATALVVLLGGIIGAIATAVGQNTGTTLNDLAKDAGTTGLVGAIVLAVVMLVSYYAGGYVAGRMSRFDGARQGGAVWVIGVLITIIAGVVGWIFGDQYNVLNRVDLPSIHINLPSDTATVGTIVTAVVVIVVTLLGAIAGGKVGQRYHTKVDRFGTRY